ncbi:MAG: hypothetical protein WC184_05945 [Acidimicrobiia bacterium]
MASGEEQLPLEKQAGQYAIRGAISGFIIVLVLVTGIGLWQDQTSASALGVGIFVAVWAGSGFGAMMGAAIAAMKNTSWFE